MRALMAPSRTDYRSTSAVLRGHDLTLLLQRQEGGVAAGGGGVGRDGALGCEAVQVAGAAGLGAGAGEAFAAKGLHTDDGADHAAIDIAVADFDPREDVAHGLVDAAMGPSGDAITGRGGRVDDRMQ